CYHDCPFAPHLSSAVGRVERDIARDLAFPAVAVGEEFLLVVQKLFASFRREFEIRSLDDRIDRAGFLAEAAVDALHHVNVIAGRAPCAVVAARSRFDGDRLRGANRLTELAGDATLLAIGIAAQGML